MAHAADSQQQLCRRPMPGACPCQRRSRTGSTRSLLTMVDRAMVSTITMPVAAESPPMKTASASQGVPKAIGRVSTKVSGVDAAVREGQQARHRDGDDEQVDQQQVEREQPDRPRGSGARRCSPPPLPGTGGAAASPRSPPAARSRTSSSSGADGGLEQRDNPGLDPAAGGSSASSPKPSRPRVTNRPHGQEGQRA